MYHNKTNLNQEFKNTLYIASLEANYELLVHSMAYIPYELTSGIGLPTTKAQDPHGS